MRCGLALVGLLCGCGVGDYSLSAECKVRNDKLQQIFPDAGCKDK